MEKGRTDGGEKMSDFDVDDREYIEEDENWDSTEYVKKELGFDPAIKLSSEDEKDIKAMVDGL
jgi:hypothetical protein